MIASDLKKMKTTGVILIIMLVLMECSTGGDAKIRHADLVGKWNWLRTDGSFGF